MNKNFISYQAIKTPINSIIAPVRITVLFIIYLFAADYYRFFWKKSMRVRRRCWLVPGPSLMPWVRIG